MADSSVFPMDDQGIVLNEEKGKKQINFSFMFIIEFQT